MAAVSDVLTQLLIGSLVGQKGKAERRFQSEFDELVSVRRKIEILLNNGDSSREVAAEIRDVAYKIEDLVETFEAEAEAANMSIKTSEASSIFRRRSRKQKDAEKAILKAKIGFLIRKRSIRRSISWFNKTFPDDVFEGENGARVAMNRQTLQLPRQMYGLEDHFVRTKDLKEVLARVDKHRVVMICGVQGLGKSSLARKVYTDPKITSDFDALAWVSLTQDHPIQMLFQSVLNQLGAEKQRRGAEETEINEFLQSIEDEEAAANGPEAEESRAETVKKSEGIDRVIGKLKKIQNKKKCFIVIDGISETSQWNEISSVFDGKATRILLTVQDAKIIDDAVSYELKRLDQDEGWNLLREQVFRGKKAPVKGIVPKFGKEMVDKCSGLPLNISSLGRTLSTMPLSEWHKVNDNVTDFFQRGYQNQSNERPVNVPLISYDQLHCHDLKQCFLYLSIFKENEAVASEDLKFLWIAEGMVSSPQQQPQQPTMDIAENYVQELVDKLSTNGRFKPLHIHNYVRNLSQHLGKREDFRLKVLDFSDGNLPSFDSSCLSDGTRRLVVHFDKPSSEKLDNLTPSDYLRSLFFLNSSPEYVESPVWVSDLKEFKLLRVLHFVRCKFKDRELPKGIDELFNLRYLGVLYCDLDELPASISNVRNLHVLNVRAYHDAKITIPNAIYEMARLGHLRLPDNLVHAQSTKLNLDGLHDLETLDGFNADIHDVGSLSKLEKLRHLVAHAYSNDSLESTIEFVASHGARVRTTLIVKSKCDFTSPEGLAILEEVLMCPNLHALTLSMALIDEFPNCGGHASEDLTEINLIGCKLSKDPMEALGKFPNLRKLFLGYGAFVGDEMTINGKGFPNLECLEFCSLANLKKWSVNDGAMKKLSSLTVKRCPKLNGIPKALKSVSSLKNLEIELEPSELDKGWMKNKRWEDKFHEMFDFVEHRTIRKFDPSSPVSSSSISLTG